MKTTKASSVILQGIMQAKHACFNNDSGEVIISGSVLYQGVEFRDIPIITIRISRIAGAVMVQEYWFTTGIPRLEAIRDFRDVLRLTISQYCNELPYGGGVEVLYKGLRLFAEKLRTFKGSICLVRFLRHSVNGLNEGDEVDAERARMALRAMGITPLDEVELIMKN